MRCKRDFTCVVCPNGCTVSAEYDGAELFGIRGHQCPRGAEYVRRELVDPHRTLSTTVPIRHAPLPLCSVRLTKPIPKDKIFAVMAEIKKCSLDAPVKIGDVVLRNVLGLDSDVIVTKNLEKV